MDLINLEQIKFCFEGFVILTRFYSSADMQNLAYRESFIIGGSELPSTLRIGLRVHYAFFLIRYLNLKTFQFWNGLMQWWCWRWVVLNFNYPRLFLQNFPFWGCVSFTPGQTALMPQQVLSTSPRPCPIFITFGIERSVFNFPTFGHEIRSIVFKLRWAVSFWKKALYSDSLLVYKWILSNSPDIVFKRSVMASFIPSIASIGSLIEKEQLFYWVQIFWDTVFIF